MIDREKLVRKIKSLSDSIRRKHRALKMGISERDKFLESTFKPVIDPLKEISQKLNATSPVIDTERILPVKEEANEQRETNAEQTGKPLRTDSESGTSRTSDDDNEDEEEEEMEDQGDVGVEQQQQQVPGESNLSVLGKEISSQGELTRKYVLKMLHSTIANRKYHVYGARVEKGGLMIGDSTLIVDDTDNITVKGKTYPGTIGLFELIFKKTPMKYTAKDLKMFKKILIDTNAHKKHYKLDSPLHRSSSFKFKNIIAKLFQNKHVAGKGMSMKDSYTTNVIYYNNINKLVERMRLLHEAQIAGHTGVNNEMVALTEELRGRGYIM